jgi:hypothetical protein
MADPPLDDLSVISEGARVALNSVMETGESTLATLSGARGKGDMIVTDRRIAVFKNEILRWWGYPELTAVVVHGGFTSHVALAGPDIPAKKLGLSDVAFAPHGLQLGDGKRAARLAEVANRFIADPWGPPADLSRPRVAGAGLEGALFVARAPGGYVALWPERIKIKHLGFIGLTKGIYKGDKEIPIDQITAIQWREPGGIVSGHIQFTIMGGSSDSKAGSADENSMMFEGDTRADFATLKRLVEERMASYRSARYAPQAPVPAGPDLMDQIRKLGELHAAGILTDDEFNAKKAELLARM